MALPNYDITGTRPRCVLPFEAAPAEVPPLRRAAARQLSQWGMAVALDEAELLVTELATNVIKHVGEGASATLVLERGEGRLRIELHDRSRVLPLVTKAGCDEECGRGLHLLSALAADWGAVLTAAGKSVWCEVAVGPAGDCPRVARAVEAIENYQESRGVTVLRGGRLSSVLEESAIELIADLIHWTAARGHDPDDILDRAQTRYEAEAGAA
ncbi:ATP-binding protein [Streptomyces sp. MAA16]|uniref:ATP-binding protein n=1 Tax=Streptomyces sp. MAA16 TaxID=3035116 RepID=UPI002472E975|nr:ATP-binding protein [Streptomyces sp. MAA16]